MLANSRFAKAIALPLKRRPFQALCLVAVTACAIRQPPNIPRGGIGTLVVSVVDTAGPPKATINAYIAEDLRVTSEVVTRGRAGAWTDSTGFVNLGGWRPGNYTLVVRAPGFKEERRAVVLRAGRVDTVRVIVKYEHIRMQSS